MDIDDHDALVSAHKQKQLEELCALVVQLGLAVFDDQPETSAAT